MLRFPVICLAAFLSQTLAEQSCKDHRSVHGFALVDHAYESFTADRLAICYSACNMQPACQSLNYNLADKTCQFNNDTKYFRSEYLVEKAISVYADNPDSEVPWRKLNADPVCFGAKDNQFGSFHVAVGGSVEAVKLVHIYGSVSCRAGDFSKWGCEISDTLHTVLTTSSDVILLPETKEVWYSLPGYSSDSKEIMFVGLTNPLLLSSGQELRLWYSEDFKNAYESNNAGTTCADVYAKYI